MQLGDSGLDLNVKLGRGHGEGSLRVGRGSAILTYLNVTPQHAGLYECRVDFYTSPAHTTYVNLTVVGEYCWVKRGAGGLEGNGGQLASAALTYLSNLS